LADYESRASYYASDPGALLAIKQRLQKQRTTNALFNPAQFARALEQQYQNMWQDGSTSN
jgi:predicted O-linked N-acetylglucosamine transferase (SPINDLY family)